MKDKKQMWKIGGFSYVHSVMFYKGFMRNNKSLIQIEDLWRSNSKDTE